MFPDAQEFSALGADGQRITGHGQFELDRTEYGSHYGSGKLFRFLGKHIVNDPRGAGGVN